EALARRRAAQVEAALLEARASFDGGELEQALDACEQALTLDDTNPLAIELEGSIKLAIDKQRAGLLIADARTELGRGALTAAMTLLQQARALDPEASEAKRLDRDLRLARVEQEERRQRAEAASQSLAAAAQALDRGDVEAALASARKAVALDPESSQARSLEAEAMRRLNEGVEPSGVHVMDKTILAPPKRTPAPPPAASKRTPAPPPVAAKRTPAPAPGTAKRSAMAPPAVKRPAVDRLAPLRAFVALVQTRIGQAAIAAKPHRRTLAIAGAVAAALVVAVVGAVVVLRQAGPLPTGTLVVEALPWATITAVEAADGSSLPLPAPASTPLSIALPAGTYTVRVAGPPPDSESRAISVQIQENAVAVMPVERFRTVTPEEYFEQYLVMPSPAPAAEAPATVPDSGASPPADPATPPPPDAASPAAAKPPGAVL
ncbi:MAG: hypothetical protein ACRD26_17950, partial [Vicinamibacterales bacterium]